MICRSYIASYPYRVIPDLMRKLEKEGRYDLLEAVRERYATMKPNQRIRVIHYDKRTEKNQRAPDTP